MIRPIATALVLAVVATACTGNDPSAAPASLSDPVPFWYDEVTGNALTVGNGREPAVLPHVTPDATGVCFYENGSFTRCDTTPDPDPDQQWFQMYPSINLDASDVLTAEWTGIDEVEYTSTWPPPPPPTSPPTTEPTVPESTAPPHTTPATTSPPPPGTQFLETFDGDLGLDRFTWGVYHRNVGTQEHGQPINDFGWSNADHGGAWTGDHDLACGDVTTQRSLSSSRSSFRVDELVYVCRNHLMTTMGDVDGYSIVWFSPDETFTDVTSVCFDVNLTDLGTRQWWKVGIVSEARYQSQTESWLSGWFGPETYVPAFVVSDVPPSNLDGLDGPDIIVATWSGGASNAGYPGGMAIRDQHLNAGFDAGADKATRHPVCLVDNQDGTVTFTVAGSSGTAPDSFPAGPVRVVFFDHNYTPDKSESSFGVQRGYTWHWDNIEIE